MIEEERAKQTDECTSYVVIMKVLYQTEFHCSTVQLGEIQLEMSMNDAFMVIANTFVTLHKPYCFRNWHYHQSCSATGLG